MTLDVVVCVVVMDVHSLSLCLSLSIGGKTPDPNARTYKDAMMEQALRREEVCSLTTLPPSLTPPLSPFPSPSLPFINPLYTNILTLIFRGK